MRPLRAHEPPEIAVRLEHDRRPSRGGRVVAQPVDRDDRNGGPVVAGAEGGSDPAALLDDRLRERDRHALRIRLPRLVDCLQVVVEIFHRHGSVFLEAGQRRLAGDGLCVVAAPRSGDHERRCCAHEPGGRRTSPDARCRHGRRAYRVTVSAL